MAIRLTLIIIFLNTLIACNDNTDKIETYIANNTQAISSIEPNATNFDDLSIIGSAIGNKRIVLLGEQDHGDANTFLAKTRLIKGLHKEKGFTRLLFEEDFSSLLLHDINSINNSEIRINNTLDDYWLKCHSFSYLLDYLSKTEKGQNPLKYSGMDIYLDGKVAVDLLKTELEKITAENPDSNLGLVFNKIIEFFTYSTDRNLQSLGRAHITSLLVDFKNITENIQLNKNQTHLFKNIQAYMQSLLANYGATIRDKQMANNILWYFDNHLEEKFIVWTANTHAAKNAWEMITGEFGRRRSMGEHLFKAKPDDLYSIGTMSYQGHYGRVGQSLKPIEQPSSNSLDFWLHKTKNQYAFIDFALFNLNQPNYTSMYKAKGLSHQLEKGQWHNIFDGVLFIDNMKSCLQ